MTQSDQRARDEVKHYIISLLVGLLGVAAKTRIHIIEQKLVKPT